MFKRPLVICAILFFAGILCSVYNLKWLLLLLLISPFFLARFMAKGKLGLFYLAVAVLLSGAIRMDFADIKKRDVISNHAGEYQNLSLVITEPSDNGRAVAFFEKDGKKIHVYLSVKEKNLFSCGDIVTGDMTLHAPFKNNSGSSFENSLAAKGVYLQASADAVRITGTFRSGIMGRIYTLRRYIDTAGKRIFHGDRRALFNAMILGDKSLLSDELYGALSGSGLNHIAVVSGMHLSVTIAFIIFVFRKIFGKGRIGFVLAILCGILITLATGAGASVVRALLMCILFYLAHLLCRESDSLTNLFCAFWVMLLVNPYMFFNVGFTLSVLSVLGIILFAEKFSALFSRFMPKMVASAISLTFAAQLSITPIVVYYFGIITPYAPISNIVAVPLSSLYVVTGLLLSVFSSIGILSAILSVIMNFLAAGIELVCYRISSLPCAAIECNAPFMIFTLIWVFLAVMIFYHPASSRKIAKTVGVFAAASFLAVCLFSGSEESVTFTPYGQYTVAQGETKDGAFLVDCPDYYAVNLTDIPYESIVVSGKDVQESLHIENNIKKVYLPEGLFDHNAQAKLIEESRESGTTLIFVADKEGFRTGGATMRYIPVKDLPDCRALEINFGGKKIVSLQGLSHWELEKAVEGGFPLPCDYVYIPELTAKKTVYVTK